MTDSVNQNLPKEEAIATAQTVIPVIEEVAVVGSKVVETGKVHISKTITEEEQSLHLVGSQEECEVERVTLNKVVETAPPVRYEGDTMIIPVLKEVAVVEKRLMLVEEVRVTRRQKQTQETVPVTLRKETVEVVREKTDGSQTTLPH